MARRPALAEQPAGLEYLPDFVTPEEESGLLSELERVQFREVQMHGRTARRTVAHFGFDYDYESWRLKPAEPLPGSFAGLRDRCAELIGAPPEELVEALATCYPPGATIGWHRDAPMFGAKVVGVSLLSACRMRFQRTAAAVRQVHELELAPRSAYVLGGAARSCWQHSIPPTKSLRYSITFRTLRNPSRWQR